MRKVLARYVIREILGPFTLILVIATFVLLMHRIVRLTDMIVNKGVPALDVLLLILYIMPRFLAFTIPIAVLMAVMIAFGRLNGDSEIIAMKASGVSLGALLRPTLGVAAVLGGVTAYFTLFALPTGNRAVENLLFEIARTRATVAITPGVFSNEFSRFVLYVES
ncbi:MAG: LptF/LptG family permease, partial [Myxococcales bacterium]|nr:LptF/LptG family permease [Myxococcales bacterium]